MKKESKVLGSHLCAMPFKCFMLFLVMMFSTSTARAQEDKERLQSWISEINKNHFFTLNFITYEKYEQICNQYQLTDDDATEMNPYLILCTGSRKITIDNSYEDDCYDYYIYCDEIEAPEDCSNMFNGMDRLIAATFDNFDTSNVTNMNSMFAECDHLASLDLSNFDTSNVTDMNSMFCNCVNLASLDLSNFDTSNVTDMNNMFVACCSLTSLDLSNFNTSKVTDMGGMIRSCNKLTSLDISNFNTSNVTSMGGMFEYNHNLSSLDLSNFDTSNVTHMIGMFRECSNLSSLTIGNFDMHNVESELKAHWIFDDTPKLKTLTLKAMPNLKDGTFNSKFTGEGVTVKYELDDNSLVHTGTTNYLPAATAPASYSRTMANQWGTIVLPFNVTISSSNPYDFYKISSVNGDELSLSKITGSLPAGTPALIRLYDNVVSGNPYELNITAADNNLNTSGDLTKTAGDLSLVGAYDYKDITAENGYIISNNAFWNIQEVKGENKVYCAPFRAYIAGTASESRLRIGTADESTGIAALDALNSADAEYYDINGRKQNGLKNGVNIIKANGKVMKVIVR